MIDQESDVEPRPNTDHRRPESAPSQPGPTQEPGQDATSRRYRGYFGSEPLARLIEEAR